ETVRDRVFGAIFVIRLALGQSGWQIWNLAIGRIHDRALSATDSIRSHMRLDVCVVRIIEDLPDSAQVRFAIRCTRNRGTSRGLTSCSRLAAGGRYCD